MKIKKTITLFLVGLFLSTALFSPYICKEGSANEESKMLTIYLPGITENDYSTQKEISEEESQTFSTGLNALLDVINSSISINGPGGKIITEEEWQQISDKVNELINSTKIFVENFPNINTEQLVSKIVNSLLNPFGDFFLPRPFFSIGIGFTWIPFYDYETFVGVMFRPMLTVYLYGWTQRGILFNKITLSGRYSMLTVKFSGIFMNLGDIGVDRILGPTLYIGTVSYFRT